MILKDFIAYLEEQARNHSIYVWGGQGECGPQITEAWIKKRENSTDNANRAIGFWKKQVAAGYGSVLRAFDCSGLGMYYFKNLMGYYKSDMSANSMKGKCAKITRQDLKPGDWVFRVYTADKYDKNGKRIAKKGDAYHIGYVVDTSLNVVEAKGRDDGVVKRSVNASGSSYWNAYGRPEAFAAEIGGEEAQPPPPRLLKLTDKPYMRGEDVREVQMRLVDLCYNPDKTDGKYGPITDDAVRAFQADHGLKPDGIVGPKTRAGLMI